MPNPSFKFSTAQICAGKRNLDIGYWINDFYRISNTILTLKHNISFNISLDILYMQIILYQC